MNCSISSGTGASKPAIDTGILEALQKIRELPDQDLQLAVNTVIPGDRVISATFWTSYTAKETAIGRGFGDIHCRASRPG
jgi:hypothetical protein